MNTNDTYKENLINKLKAELTPEQIAKNIEGKKKKLINLVELVGKEDAIACVESKKTIIWESGLSTFDIDQAITDNFDQIAFIQGLPSFEYAA